MTRFQCAAGQEPLLERIVEVLRTVYDPEIPVNIFELGMIYGIEVAADGALRVRMTLTSPACPVAGSLPGEVQGRLSILEGVPSVDVELVWDPPWNLSFMSESARLQLNL